jgi:hypothetical protein
MNSLYCEVLDASSARAREEYERVFYDAFRRAHGNKLIRQLWLWDDAAQRVATRIPYDDQTVYVMRDGNGQIVTGLGVNHVLRSFQSSAYGFDLPLPGDGCCEFLTMFSVNEYRLKTRFAFLNEAFADLSQRDFHTAYATTARRVLNAYVWMGGTILKENTIEGEERFFLKFSLWEKHVDTCR